MNRILALDAQSGTVTLEPGVTQRMNADGLRQRGLNPVAPITGAGPEAGILGNALERGNGITPHTDNFGAVQCIEAVLPNGEQYRSALTDGVFEAVDGVNKWG